MTIGKLSAVAMRTALVVSVATLSAQAFTGDVPTDFVGPDVVVLADPMDVGLPLQAPGGTISGWEIAFAAFELDADNDLLRVGLDYVGMAGDADGDGNASNSSAWLLGNGGVDLPNLGGTESICIAFDFDQDMNFDLIAGVDGFTDATNCRVANYTNGGLLPFSFGAPAPAHQGMHMIGPDFEFEIANLSGVSNYMNMDTYCFDFALFSGSFADDGVGEDFMMGEVCLENRSADTEDLVSNFQLEANYPNPFNPTTTLSFTMESTEVANLSVYNMVGQKVATLVDGVVGSGSHEVVFDASNLSSGVYFYTLSAGANVETRKMVLTK